MAKSFDSRWADKEIAIGVPAEIRAEMIAFGDALLPSEAAPFLSFTDASAGRRFWESVYMGSLSVKPPCDLAHTCSLSNGTI